MSGGRCQLQREEMTTGAGAEGGRGAEEVTFPISRRSQMPEVSTSELGFNSDFFSRARKALSERSPFDIPEDASAPLTAVPTLPGELAALLKHSDSRKRNKKSHSGGDNKKKKKKSAKPGERPRGRDIWSETEDYFRDLKLPDIDNLSDVASGSSLAATKCLALQHYESNNNRDNAEGPDSGNCDGAVHREDKEAMELDDVEDEQACSVSGSCSSSLEWLLGCRDKIYLTTERPSKKRKLLGSDAGLEKVFVAHPCGDDSTICDFCCLGASGTDSNPLVVCSSCRVTVHRKCYGVVEEAGGSWLCSWCKQKESRSRSDYSCVLCPKQEGALKPVQTSGLVEFAHLFCSQWMPEVYIQDLTRMEPILNVERIAETRRKLVCNVCKIKCGVCVRCSHGTCRTSFHPICAREARHRMEIWGKFGDDNVELRAFCSKHSEVQPGGIVLQSEGTSMTAADDSYTGCSSPGTLPVKESQNSKVSCRNGDEAVMQLEEPDSSEVSDCSELQEVSLNDTKISSEHNSGTDACQLNFLDKVETNYGEEAKEIDPLNLLLVLKKLIDGGKVSVKDVASDIGVSPDSLAAKLAGDSLLPDLRCKLVKWLKSHAYLGTVEKDPKLKIRRAVSTKARDGVTDDSDSVAVSVSDVSHPVAVKSVPPRRRTKSNIRVLKDSNLLCSSDNTSAVDNMSHVELSKKNISHVVLEEADESLSLADVLDKASLLQKSEADSFEDSLPRDSKAYDGSNEGETSHGVISANAFDSSNTQHQQLKSNSANRETAGANIDQLAEARKMGLLELSPDDEVEGEIFYFQYRLLHNVRSRKPISDNLIRSIEKSLPQEIDAAHSQKWDAVLLNRYLYERREAKKQGRKEKKHKEAQAVLAAATAAAAASSRSSSFRKDPLDDSANQEKFLNVNITNGRAGPRASETVSRVGMLRDSADRHVDFGKEYTKLCDICSRAEKIMNPILVCSSCKVAVHLDCYRNVRESTGPWYCELCEDLKCSGARDVEFWEKFGSVSECALCGGTTGAFRKSTSGQWVHAFCAEWVFEGTFRRGQVNPVVGMDTISKELDECVICHHKYGVCIKCNYGHCQSTFHPSCARGSGLFMIVKSVGGKLLHKAYCMKHSSEQKAKVESQRYGAEELKSIKQIRVELERLRLLCERIVKREKVKREIVLCTQEILSLKRNTAARLALAQSPFFHPSADVSSDSATTTSINNRSGSEATAVQKSDDMTVDSSVAGKRRPRVTFSLGSSGTDHRTDDGSTSHQKNLIRKPSGKAPLPGKTIPKRPPPPVASRNLSDDGEIRLQQYKKRTETLEKELVMTSDQADLKNKLLPKGYAYVPSDSIPPKDKWTNRDSCPGEPLEDGG
ncbi:hypothetical protein CDL15_Pgr003877 [Punica granatum]|uniref:Protein Jade-1 n=1 Tax=Punica granatum TaxID=22663 RepID=A0A218XTJ2_PUNGR|nr:hypothetical protein CDL15_Pgr003877 [Punica granatum]